MRFLLAFLLFTALFAAATLVGIPYFVSTDSLERNVVSLVKRETGRDLAFEGGLDVVVFPKLGLRARKVSLSNPSAMDEGTFVEMKELRIALKVLPLVAGNIDLDELVLVEPAFHLEVDSRRQSNWTFAASRTPPQTAAGEAAPAQPDAAAGSEDDGDGNGNGGAAVDLSGLRLGRVSVVDGSLSYSDALTSAQHSARKINISVAMSHFAEPLEVDGSALWNGEQARFELMLNSPAAFIDGKLAGFELKLDAPALSAEANGTVARAARAEGFIIEGKVEAKSPSLRHLAAWAATPMAPGKGLEDFSASARLNLANGVITLSDAKLGLDGMQAVGTAAFSRGGLRPAVEAALFVETLDLNRYVSSGGGGGTGGAGRAGWSDEPIDFSGLKAADADLKLSAKRIRYGELEMGNSALTVAIRDGELIANLTELAIYGGTARGKMVLNGTGKVPRLSTAAVFKSVSALPLLSNGIGFDWIEGNADLTVDLSTAGATQKQMMAALAGKGSVQFTDGALRGFNLAQMLRSLGSATLSGWNRGGARKTDFSSLSGTFTMDKGVASNSDLEMFSPLVRLSGGGTVDIARRRLDYRLTPKLVASLEGQGGAAGLAGLNVPVIVKGPWASPKIYPDIEGILDDPEAAYGRLKQVGEQIRQGGARSLIDTLLGSPTPAPGAAPAPEQSTEDAGTTLRRIEEQLQKDPLKAFKKLF